MAQTGGFEAAIPTVTQISNYLAAMAAGANPNGLYVISSGSNDVSFATMVREWALPVQSAGLSHFSCQAASQVRWPGCRPSRRAHHRGAGSALFVPDSATVLAT